MDGAELQWLRQVKRNRALQGCNHAEGYPGGAHRADAQQRGSQSSRAVHCEEKPSDDRPPCLENPRPEGAESTLTENAASPLRVEPKQVTERPGLGRVETPKAALIVVMAESKLVRRHDSRVHYSRATGLA